MAKTRSVVISMRLPAERGNRLKRTAIRHGWTMSDASARLVEEGRAAPENSAAMERTILVSTGGLTNRRDFSQTSVTAHSDITRKEFSLPNESLASPSSTETRLKFRSAISENNTYEKTLGGFQQPKTGWNEFASSVGCMVND